MSECLWGFFDLSDDIKPRPPASVCLVLKSQTARMAHTHSDAMFGNAFPGMEPKRFSKMRKLVWMRWVPAGKVPVRKTGKIDSTGLEEEDRGKGNLTARESST